MFLNTIVMWHSDSDEGMEAGLRDLSERGDKSVESTYTCLH